MDRTAQSWGWVHIILWPALWVDGKKVLIFQSFLRYHFLQEKNPLFLSLLDEYMKPLLVEKDNHELLFVPIEAIAKSQVANKPDGFPAAAEFIHELLHSPASF